jgi:hypothetical protein
MALRTLEQASSEQQVAREIYQGATELQITAAKITALSAAARDCVDYGEADDVKRSQLGRAFLLIEMMGDLAEHVRAAGEAPEVKSNALQRA